jgi:hypothetical protein
LSWRSGRSSGHDAGYDDELKLTVNETKTRVSKLPEEKFDFLGYTFGRRSGHTAFRGRNRDVSSESRMRSLRLSGSMSGV